jgi:hypothetical protein
VSTKAAFPTHLTSCVSINQKIDIDHDSKSAYVFSGRVGVRISPSSTFNRILPVDRQSFYRSVDWVNAQGERTTYAAAGTFDGR